MARAANEDISCTHELNHSAILCALPSLDDLIQGEESEAPHLNTVHFEAPQFETPDP